ncbi:AfsR/SARP family transcriptional regulator [Cupriavidus sp. D39]|uniref:AfsR/SARP family transcriptional regulator n=1 Tax=Cupriavidus sp. D39 TaxID=2997877 RepID=UPI003B638B9A
MALAIQDLHAWRFLAIDGWRPLRFTGKAQRKPLDLLKVLVANGGRSVDINIIMNSLWPDSCGDAAQKSFDTTLHRLRKLTANDLVILTNRGISLNTNICWVDLWEFTQLVSSDFHRGAHGIISDDSGRRIVDVVDRVLKIYRGDFLCFEESNQWIISPRDKIKSKLIRFINKAGNFLEREGNWICAIELYRRGLEVDNLSEDLYRSLMECQRRAGSLSDAMETYRRCRHMLSVVLCIAPSERTASLYRELTRQGSGYLVVPTESRETTQSIGIGVSEVTGIAPGLPNPLTGRINRPDAEPEIIYSGVLRADSIRKDRCGE